MGQREVGKVGNWHSLLSVPLCPLSPHQHCTDSPFLSPALLCCPACPACAPERSPSRVSGALGMWGHWGGEWWGEAWRLCWVGGALLQLWDGSSALQWGSCPQGWPCWNRAGGFGLERWECGSIAGKGWVGGGGHRAGCLPSHLVSSAQSVSASPPESPPDEEMGLKRSQEEKELPGHYVSVGLLGGGAGILQGDTLKVT